MLVREKSPEFPPINFENTGHALQRLIDIALTGDHGGARRVADFLLAWWNGPDNGHFAILDITYVDYEIGIDMLTILAFLNRGGVSYADAWGHRRNIEAVIDKWRIVD